MDAETGLLDGSFSRQEFRRSPLRRGSAKASPAVGGISARDRRLPYRKLSFRQSFAALQWVQSGHLTRYPEGLDQIRNSLTITEMDLQAPTAKRTDGFASAVRPRSPKP